MLAAGPFPGGKVVTQDPIIFQLKGYRIRGWNVCPSVLRHMLIEEEGVASGIDKMSR